MTETSWTDWTAPAPAEPRTGITDAPETQGGYSIDNIVDVTAIDPAQVQDAFMRLPGEVAHWAAKLAKASRELTLTKARAQMMENRLVARVRDEIGASSGRKASLSESERKARSTQQWLEWQTEIARAEEAKVLAKGVLDALTAKRDALISVGASLRAEMNNLDPRIRA
jgi:hypothetical protein